MRTQAEKDTAFEDALTRRDEDALAVECETRLRDQIRGGSLFFKLGPGQPAVWRQPVWEYETQPPYAKWGRKAAQALLKASAK